MAPQPKPPRITHIILRISDAHIYHGHTTCTPRLAWGYASCASPMRHARTRWTHRRCAGNQPPTTHRRCVRYQATVTDASEMRKMGNPTCMHVGYAKTPSPLRRVGDAQDTPPTVTDASPPVANILLRISDAHIYHGHTTCTPRLAWGYASCASPMRHARTRRMHRRCAGVFDSKKIGFASANRPLVDIRYFFHRIFSIYLR